MAVLLLQPVVVDEVGEAEEDGAEEGEVGGVLEGGVEDAADQRAVHQLDAYRHDE